VNAVDWVLVAVIVLFAITGWRQGLVRGVLSMAGFLVGLVAAVVFVPDLLDRWTIPPVERGVVSLVLLLLAAFAGQLLGAWLGRWLYERISWRPVQVVDAAAGTAFSLLALAVVVWVAASAVAVLPNQGFASEVRQSSLLSRFDSVVPDVARGWAGGLRQALDSSAFPRVFAGISEPAPLPVDPPDPSLLKVPAVRRAWSSLVRVEGIATACGQQVTGSGFVFADHRVMTNAHVVAGVTAPEVRLRGTGEAYDARVVYLDPRTDIAVLDVPQLVARRLAFDGPAGTGDPAVVAGFPGGGALTVGAARVRSLIEARGRDIYGNGVVLREVYSFRGTVRPGSSGGPLLSPAGDVLGVVFAAASDDPETGYALTAAQVAKAAAAGAAATAEVDTGSCATR
jgi:S1-C subfamily serine protease